ncbi:MAG: vitamin K epoxide reductase family protein [Pseudomonadota bacterium]
MDKKKEWPYRLLALLWGLGLGIALRLTWHHENSLYGDSQAKLGLCPENAVINCDVVNTSRYSEFLGFPIAVFAIPTYLFLLFLILIRKRFSQVPLLLL